MKHGRGPGIQFGDHRHPYRQTSEMARKAGKKGRAASPWGKTCFSEKAAAEGG